MDDYGFNPPPILARNHNLTITVPTGLEENDLATLRSDVIVEKASQCLRGTLKLP